MVGLQVIGGSASIVKEDRTGKSEEEAGRKQNGGKGRIAKSGRWKNDKKGDVEWRRKVSVSAKRPTYAATRGVYRKLWSTGTSENGARTGVWGD